MTRPEIPRRPVIPTLTLERFAYTADGTFGRLLEHRAEGRRPWSGLWTVEREWLDNVPFRSCIPEGRYWVLPRDSERFGAVMEVASVPGRTDILFHAANAAHQLEGCIAPGWGFGPLSWIEDRPLGVTRSRLALAFLTGQIGREFRLIVTSSPRTPREMGLDLGLAPDLDAGLGTWTCGHPDAQFGPRTWAA